MMSTYDVRIWSIRDTRKSARRARRPSPTACGGWSPAASSADSFQTKALAESFRSKLVTAQREGVAFDEASGLPEPMARELNTRTWYEHAVAFVDMKWPRAAGNAAQEHRRITGHM